MATSSLDTEESLLTQKFESWFVEKIKSRDQETDASIFINYILSTLNAEDSSDEEKAEAILPFLQELNQNNTFDEQQLLDEIIKTWNQMKIEFEQNQNNKPEENQENPTDTILSMINKHKTQIVKTKKNDSHETGEDDYEDDDNSGHAVDHHFVYEESDEEEVGSNKDSDLFVNKNSEDAVNREKLKRDKMAEATRKQKEQAKKALIDQRQREEDKKKKAQQKAAKVERKR
ncbi:unnamed protein product [Brachionus calyciflorus]|uniref:Coiled-coil domain-containing protein 43 n=1 Tax=Brachionus calyciflorus TaxID=104777 RepID=A0A813M1L0_9BILA|nr:unnamed protein product [Brachionus calyciflorus]